MTAPIVQLRRPLAALAWLLAAGCPVAIAILVLVSPMPEQDAWAIPLYSLIVATWGLAGAFLVTRRPDNRVGWVIWAAGVGIGTALVGQLWAYRSLAAYGGSLLGTTAGGIVGLLFGPSLYLVMLVPLLPARTVTITGHPRFSLTTINLARQVASMSWSMESTHDAAVAPEDVFRYYADPASWGEWAHNTAWGRGRTPLETGSTVEVRVRSYPWTYTVRVRELEPGRRMVTEVRPFGVTITSTYEVAPMATGSRLHHTISLAGPLERAYKLVRGQYTRMLVTETRRVAELAAGDQPPLGASSTQRSTAQA